MATLTKSTGTVTLSGAVEKVTFPAVYGWVWVKNMSDADMFVGLSESVSAGADGVMRIPAGECGRIQTDGQDSVYLIGSGNALVVAQNYAECPFKVGGKGGEIPDLSEYAKTADVPNIKVNAAVDADTVGGHSVGCDVPENAVFTDTVPDLSLYAKTADVPNIKVNSAVNADTVGGVSAAEFMRYQPAAALSTSINDMVTAGTYGVYYSTPDFPNGYGSWGLLDVRRYGNNCYQIVYFESGFIIYRAKNVNGAVWTDWENLNRPYATGTLSEQASDSPVTMSFTIFDFTPSKVICQFGSGSAFFANVVTNGFSLTIPAGTNTIHYIAFK